MKLIVKIFLAVVLVSQILFAQADYVDKDKAKKALSPKIYFDAYNYLSNDSGKTELKMFFQIPYTSLSFIRKNNKFLASYSIETDFYDSSGTRLLFEKLWKEKLVAPNYKSARDYKNFNISSKKFTLTPGVYSVKILITDKYSLSKVDFKKKITVRKINPDFGISDLMLFQGKTKDGRIIPNIKNIVSSGQDSLDVFFYVYSGKERNVLMKFRIYSIESDEAFIVNSSQLMKKGKNKITFTVKPIKLKLGKYNLGVAVIDDDTEKSVSITKNFFVRIKYFPPSITDLNLAIEEMQYIAPPSVIDDLLETKDYNERLKKFEDFWKSKDPSPDTPINEVLYEYYRRVDYANKHFEHYFPGWKTDMGKVYITLGPPHQVERHPLELGTKPYQVWYYYDINREFVFVDETGFGDYKLITPLYGDWYRYRQ